jgi:eukaryotic-like serine/threonine-protein kinase
VPAVAAKIRVHCPVSKCAKPYLAPVSDLTKPLYCQQCQMKFRLGQFGHYVVLEELGRGSFGVVNRVYDLTENREVAIKLLNTDKLPPDKFEEWINRARQEAQLIAKIVHPNILPLHHSGMHDGKFYMVTPLLPGQPLDKAIAKGEFDDPLVAVEIVVTVLRALHSVHGQNIFHRDVKPGNIMVGEGGKIVYLMDFGLAVFHEKGAATIKESNSLVGTVAYMPPEQAAGQVGKVGALSDQYSAGVVLYKLLSGALPYVGSAQEMLRDIVNLNRLPTPLRKHRPDLDSALEAIVSRSLAKDPNQRFESCEEFADELVEWADSWKAQQRRTGTGLFSTTRSKAGASRVRDAVAPAKRPAWQLWGGVGALVVMGIVVIYVATRGPKDAKDTNNTPAAPAAAPKKSDDWTK